MRPAPLRRSPANSSQTCIDQAGGVTSSVMARIGTETELQHARLNKAHQALSAKLQPTRKTLLLEAQRAWKAMAKAASSSIIQGALVGACQRPRDPAKPARKDPAAGVHAPTNRSPAGLFRSQPGISLLTALCSAHLRRAGWASRRARR